MEQANSHHPTIKLTAEVSNNNNNNNHNVYYFYSAFYI